MHGPDPLQLVRVANFLGFPPKRNEAAERGGCSVGLLGASQVSTYAAIAPVRQVPGAQVTSVAARCKLKAAQFAQQHRIPASYGSYDSLLADPDIRAVYVGLPNGLHGQWARRALEAGKHVLCEKPFAANAAEAREIQKLALEKGLLCREAQHHREHPLATRLRQITLGPSSSTNPCVPAWMAPPLQPGGTGGLLGPLLSIDVQVLIPKWVFSGGNIRFSEELAGGAMMDAGVYTASMMRLLSGAQPRVDSAQAVLQPGSKVVDAAMHASLSWPGLPKLRGSLTASLQHEGWLPVTSINVQGERGSMTCEGFIVPFFGHKIRCTTRAPPQEEAATGTAHAHSHKKGMANPITWTEHAYGSQQTTYFYQMERFVTDLGVLEGKDDSRDLASVHTACAFDAEDSVATAELVDACYEKAELPWRQPCVYTRSRSS